MNPAIWGSHAWFFYHAITFAYPICPTQYDKEKMKAFFHSLDGVLPCDKCKIHFQEHLKKFPLTYNVLCSRKSLVKWLIDFHNVVNVMVGKPKRSYDDVIKYYKEQGLLPNNNKNVKENSYKININLIITILLIFLVLLLLTYIIWKKY